MRAKKAVKQFFYDLIHMFVNYVVAYIPFWSVRKFIYMLLGMKIGKGSRINQRVFVYSPWRIEIGCNTMINSYAILDGRGKLKIGDNSSISMKSVIYSESHICNSDSFESYERETIIGNCCWIGVHAVVLPGTKAEDFVIIGANSTIKGNTVGGGIYLGSPASLVRKRSVNQPYNLTNLHFFV